MRRIVLFLALAAAAFPSMLLAQANSGRVNGEGCWCGYGTGMPRNLVIRGKSSSAAMKQAAADAINEWNRYAKVLNVTVDTTDTLGKLGNGVGEVNVFINPADALSVYGMTMEPSLFGVAVIAPEANFGNFNGCKDYVSTGCGPFIESDVLVNAAFASGWTEDWFAFGASQGSSNAAVVHATAIHEEGHSLGLHHVFDLPGKTTSFSVMNYADDDAAKWVTRMDANTIRAEYPNQAVPLTDVGVFPFVYGNGQYEQSYATLGNSSALPGEAFSLNKWTLENVGTKEALAVEVRFYAWPAGSRKYPDPADVPLGSVNFASVPVNTHAEYSGTPLTVPAGTAAGQYNVGAIVLVGGAEDSPWVAGKPNNNRFVVGHDPYLTVTVLTPPAPDAVTADFSFAPDAPLAGDPVSFTDKSLGVPATWSWSFGDPGSGDANVSTQQSPAHAFSGPGTYSITLTVAKGSNTSSISRNVTAFGSAPGLSVTRVIPIVLDVGESPRFTSELTLSNRGSTTSTLTLRYTAAPSLGASGSGTVSEILDPGRQLIVPDAIAYLRQKGLLIPGTGGQGGTLRVTFSNLSSDGAGFAGARTTTPSGNGRCGLAYPGTDVRKAFHEPVAVFGLRQGASDRSNLAVVNAGTTSPITVRVTVSPASGGKGVALADRVLQPGEWYQYNAVLTEGPWAEGKATVERVSGTEPFLAYGVFNDQRTNDGSYVGAIPVSSLASAVGVPTVVESSVFQSELVVASGSDKASSAYLHYVESLADPKGDTGWFEVALAPYEQKIVPNVIDYLRQAGAPIGPKGPIRAGYLQVAFTSQEGEAPGAAGVRTSSPAATGGEYGVYYPGSAMTGSARDAWIFGLQQGASARSNLAVSNVGTDGADIDVRLQVFDGTTGRMVSEETLPTLKPGDWYQKNSVLGSAQNGYCRLTVVKGTDSFLAYGVVNDGQDATSGTNDGSYVAMEPVLAPASGANKVIVTFPGPSSR
jgi:PKD repeat protein